MSKTIYVIANFEVGQYNDHPWMNSRPFYKNEDFKGPGIELCLLSDIFWSMAAPKGAIIKMTLYRIRVNNATEFYQKRQTLFDTSNYTAEFIASVGFENIVDFSYEVDPNNTEQFTNGHKLNISHHKLDRTKYYLSCPSIILNE